MTAPAACRASSPVSNLIVRCAVGAVVEHGLHGGDHGLEGVLTQGVYLSVAERSAASRMPSGRGRSSIEARRAVRREGRVLRATTEDRARTAGRSWCGDSVVCSVVKCSGGPAPAGPPGGQRRRPRRSMIDAVALDVGLAQVVEQPAALADQQQQAAPAVVVVLVLLQVLGEVRDAVAEQRDLHLGGTGVALGRGVLGDDLASWSPRRFRLTCGLLRFSRLRGAPGPVHPGTLDPRPLHGGFNSVTSPSRATDEE